MPTPKHSSKTCGGSVATISTTTIKKCGVKTNSGVQERHIMNV